MGSIARGRAATGGCAAIDTGNRWPCRVLVISKGTRQGGVCFNQILKSMSFVIASSVLT
jgi:hypothetical protein